VSPFPDTASLLDAFRLVLDESLMGTRLYVAGPESFIGLAMKIALQFDLNKDEIRAEEVGTLARRVYCIHCRTTTENVRTNIVSCAGCARSLLVRDHYSRRLAAYMGVMSMPKHPVTCRRSWRCTSERRANARRRGRGHRASHTLIKHFKLASADGGALPASPAARTSSW